MAVKYLAASSEEPLTPALPQNWPQPPVGQHSLRISSASQDLPLARV